MCGGSPLAGIRLLSPCISFSPSVDDYVVTFSLLKSPHHHRHASQVQLGKEVRVMQMTAYSSPKLLVGENQS